MPLWINCFAVGFVYALPFTGKGQKSGSFVVLGVVGFKYTHAGISNLKGVK